MVNQCVERIGTSIHDGGTEVKQSGGRLRNVRAGYSLLEVVMAMVVVGLILVPTASLMAQALRGERTRVKRAELLQLANGKQAEFGHLARVNFQNRSEHGDFASRGHGDLQYTVTCSDSTTQGGIPGRLQSIIVVAWYDENANRTLDAAEPHVSLWTTVARATP
jgi:prepilin-type N-terminal cleavage/methylation domain-containing protein